MSQMSFARLLPGAELGLMEQLVSAQGSMLPRHSGRRSWISLLGQGPFLTEPSKALEFLGLPSLGVRKDRRGGFSQ